MLFLQKERAIPDEIALLITGNENQSGWVIDSGATQHMTYERDNLSEYVEFKRPCKVNLGDYKFLFHMLR